MRYLVLCFSFIVVAHVHGQSWFARNFEIDKVEFKAGHDGITSQTWKDGMYGASALDHLDEAMDNAGIKQDEITLTRPFDVKYSYSDYSGYCCGNTNRNYSYRSELGVKAQLKKYWRLRVGLSVNLINRSFGFYDSYHLDDKPFGDRTLYFNEVGRTETVRLQKGFGPDQFDTSFVVPKAKLAYVHNPDHHIGLGFNGQFVLHESMSKRNHLYLNFGGSLYTATRNRTRIDFEYYNYSRIGTGEPGYGHINGFSTSENDYYQVSVDDRKSNKRFDVSFKTPALNSARIFFSLEFSRQLFKKFPLTMTLGVGARNNTFWRNWETIAASKSTFYQGGFGWLLK